MYHCPKCNKEHKLGLKQDNGDVLCPVCEKPMKELTTKELAEQYWWQKEN